MDGMFYQRQDEDRFRDEDPEPGTGRLVLVTLVVVIVVFTCVLLKPRGVAMTVPEEFPSPAVFAGD